MRTRAARSVRDGAPPRGARRLLAVGLALSLGMAVGCRQDMHDQAKYEPLEASRFYPNGMASRALPANTVARGLLKDDVGFYTGLDAARQPVAAFPTGTLRERWPGADGLDERTFRLALLERGQQRYGTFCTPCHDQAGTGNGMIVQRGFKQPPSMHEERLRNAAPGYFVNVVTEGFGQMSSYAPQISPEDRWAIAAYVKALQLGQHVPLTDLPGELRHEFEAAQTNPAGAGPDHGAGSDHGGSGGHAGEP